jgi:hypothetical protein
VTREDMSAARRIEYANKGIEIIGPM